MTMTLLTAVVVTGLLAAWGLGSLLGLAPRIYGRRETYIVGAALCLVCVVGCIETMNVALTDRIVPAPAHLWQAFLWALGLITLTIAMRHGYKRTTKPA